MKYLLLAVMGLMLGCTQEKQEKETPQSQPLYASTAGGETVQMTVYPDGRDPIGRDRLREIWPPLSSLSEDGVKLFAEAVNMMPSPCAGCGSIPIAHCYEQGQAESCPVLDKLFDRATKLASKGSPLRTVKESINYPDVWFDGMGEGSPPKVTVYRDEGGPFSAKTSEDIEDIRKQFGDSILLEVLGSDVDAPARLEVRSRPTWFINGHRFRGSQSTPILKRFIEYELSDTQK